jgi:Uracil phosphoribosyltransferase
MPISEICAIAAVRMPAIRLTRHLVLGYLSACICKFGTVSVHAVATPALACVCKLCLDHSTIERKPEAAQVLVSEIDSGIDEAGMVVPGIGEFGNRYFSS